MFRKALLCKTFTPHEEYADLNTVLYSFRKVIHRELRPILIEHPGVKAWIGLTNLYDYHDKRIDRELSIKTAPLYIGSEAGIAPLIAKAEKFIIGRNSSFTVLDSHLTYVRNINITLKVAEWDMGAAHGLAELPSGLIKKIKSLLNIKNKDNMCFAYNIAAYLLRREAAARRARELGVSATQAPSDQPAIPADLVGLWEHVRLQMRYDAEVVANPDAARTLTPPPIWPPPKPSLAPEAEMEG